MAVSIKALTFPLKSNEELKHPENINFKTQIGATTYVVNAQDDIANKVKSLMTR